MSSDIAPFTGSDVYHLISFTDLSATVANSFKVLQSFMDAVHGGIPTFIVEKDKNLKSNFGKLKGRLDRYFLIPIIREGEEKTQCVLRVFSTKKELEGTGAARKRRIPIQPILLIATIVSVSIAGYFISQLWFGSTKLPSDLPSSLLATSEYAASLMVILTVHELGHVIVSKYHMVKSSLPYFIPAPPFLWPGVYTPGTFGAVIFQKSSPVNRDELFDLGIAGPLFGFVVALIVSFIGVSLSAPVKATADMGYSYPPPILLFLVQMFPNMLRSGMALSLHPIAQAGYIGLIITCLNLFPTSQLDGGHVSRAAFGPRGHERASILSLVVLLILGSIPPHTFLPFALLLLLFSVGGAHPGPMDDVSKITKGRKMLVILGFAILVLSLPMDYLRILDYI